MVSSKRMSDDRGQMTDNRSGKRFLHPVLLTSVIRPNGHENNSDLITTGTTPGGEINSPTSTKSSSANCTPSIETKSPERPSSSVRMRPMVLPMSPSIINNSG